jgi:hypothetical protein
MELLACLRCYPDADETGIQEILVFSVDKHVH